MDSRPVSWDLMAWSFSSHGSMQDWVFKSADALCQEAGVVLSCGGAFMIYDTPNREGTLVDWHMDELAKVAAFCRARQPFCQDTQPVPQVVLLHAQDHYYASNEPLYNLGKATDPLEGALHAFLENGVPVDIRNAEDLMQSVGNYPVCVVSEQDHLSSDLIACLKDYVHKGGYLLVSGAGQTRPFDDLLGVSPLQPDDTGQQHHIPVAGKTVCAMGRWRQVAPADAQTAVVAPLLLSRDIAAQARPSGGCAATIRQVGKGKIAGIYGPLFGTYAFSHYPSVRAFVGQVIAALDHPALIKTQAPPRIQVAMRTKGNEVMIHLVNLGTDHPLSPKSPLVEHVPPAGPVSLQVPLPAMPRQVRLMPSAEPVSWTYANGSLQIQVRQVGIHDILVIDRG